MRSCIDCGRLFKPKGARNYRCPAHRHLPDQARHARRKARGQRTGSTYQWRKVRAEVLERDQHRCHWCGQPANTVDHLIPVAHGGSDDPANLVACCAFHNSSRGATVRRKP